MYELTIGPPPVADIRPFEVPRSDADARRGLLVIPAATRHGSEHPLAHPIVGRANDEHKSLHAGSGTDFMAIAGGEVEATVDGQRVVLGNRRLLGKRGPRYSHFARHF
jgi:P-type Cu+ transporter